MPFSLEESKKLLAHFDANPQKCVSCGNHEHGQFETYNSPVMLSNFDTGTNNIVQGAGYSLIMVACRKCGFVMSYSAKLLGILTK